MPNHDQPLKEFVIARTLVLQDGCRQPSGGETGQ
jgi:hypothetical protein